MKIRGQVVYAPQERIERLSIPEPNSGCWLWLGSVRKNPSGLEYGRMMAGSRTLGTRKSFAAHRFSYEAFKGSIPANMEVCHKCDTPLCVNPEHLFIGTHQDNIADRERKGRNKIVRGTDNGFSRYSEGQIRAVIAAHGKYADIAARTGVALTTVKDVKQGRAWKHLFPAPPVSTPERG